MSRYIDISAHKKINILILALMYVFSCTHAQSVTLAYGHGISSFFDLRKNTRHKETSYRPGSSATFRVTYTNTHVNDVKYQFILGIEQYSGYVSNIVSGLGGYASTKGNVFKTVLSLGNFPFVFSYNNKLDVSAGFEGHYLLGQSIRGVSNLTLMGMSEIKELNKKILRKFGFSAVGTLAYNIELNPHLVLYPQYILHLGVSNEFANIESCAYRHHLAFGVRYDLH